MRTTNISAFAMREITRAVCGIELTASDDELNMLIHIGQLVYTKGADITINDIVILKNSYQNAPQNDVPSTVYVDLMDGYYVRDGSTAIAWTPTHSEASEMVIESGDVYNFGKMSILPAYDLVLEDFIPFREKYYANANT